MAVLVARESFEGAGIPSGWAIDDAAGGTIDFDYSAAPLNGAQSLQIDAVNPTAITVSPPSFSASNTVDAFFKISLAAVPASTNTQVFQIRDSSNNMLCALVVSNSVARFRMYHGATLGSGAADLVAGTTYNVWLDYTAGTGSDGVANLYYSTTETKPGSPQISITTGDATASATNVIFRSEERGYDPILIDDFVVEDVIGDAGPLPAASFSIDSISVGSAEAGTQITINTSNAAGALSITDFGGAGAITEDSSTANSITFSAPNVSSFGDLSLNFNTAYAITVSDGSTQDTVNFTVTPPASWDYAQIVSLDPDGIYADDVDVVVGDYATGYVVSGDLGAIVDLTDGTWAVNEATVYTYAVYDVSISEWSVFVQENFSVPSFAGAVISNYYNRARIK